MFLLTVLLVTGLNLALAGGDCDPGKCPVDDGPKLTLLPVPWDCKQYIMCQWGIAHYRPCGFGLNYDHSRTVCLPPFMTECKICDLHDDGRNEQSDAKKDNDPNLPNSEESNSKSQEIDTVTKHWEIPITEKSIDDQKIDEENTTSQSPIIEGNTDDSHSNEQEKQSEPIENTTVINDTTSANTISRKCIEKSLTPVKCSQNMTDDRLMPHPDDCGLFYYCVDFTTPVCRDCPANLHFNPVKKVCDHPDFAGCAKPALTLKSGQDCNNSGCHKPFTF